jgi:hypothetical protein
MSLKTKMVKGRDKKKRWRRETICRSAPASPAGAAAARTAAMPSGHARVSYNALLNPQFNPSINPRANASINPKFNPWIHPERNTRISPKFNRSLNPLFTASLNPTCNPSLDPKRTLKFSGLCRLTPDAELIGYIVRTCNKAVLLLFDKDLNWTAYAVDNTREGYNIFDLEGNWKGYALKNHAGGWNEFNLEGDWTGFVANR